MTEKRSRAKPPARPVDPGKIPEPVSFILKNGIPVFLIESGTEDIERIEFTFAAGNARETRPLLSSSTILMLTEGTRKYKSARLNSMLDTYCAIFHPCIESDRAGIVICFLNKHIDKILDLAREILFFPLFPPAELNLLMKKRYRKYLIDKEKVQKLVGDQFFESIFGKSHPYGRQTFPADFNNLGQAALKDFHSLNYRPENMAIIVSGKIHERIAELLNFYFSGINSSGAGVNNPAALPEGEKTRIIHIEKPGAIQCAIRIGSATINKRNQDYPGLKILNVILGGYFGSRLMKNIREEKGYTYGINSSVVSLNQTGYKAISAEVSKINTQNAIDEIYKEIRRLQVEPPGKKEMSVVRNYMLGEMVRMFDGPFALAESFRSVWEFGLDNSYYYRLADKIKSIEPDEITSLAQKYYNLDDLYEITAG